MANPRNPNERARGRFSQRDRRRDDDIHETRYTEPYGFGPGEEDRYYSPGYEGGRSRGGSYIPHWRDYRQGNAGDYDESYDSRRYGYSSHSYGGERDRYPAQPVERPFEEDRYPRSRWTPERQRRFGTFGGEHRGRGPKGYTRSDERIREDINDRLTEDSWIDASDIDVAVSGSEATLNGTVDSREIKRRAEDIAYDVSGVQHVQNNLRVASNRPQEEAGRGGNIH